MLEWKEVKEKWNTAKAEVKAEREAKLDAEIKFLSEKRKVELAKRADADRFAMKQKKLATLKETNSFWGKVGKTIGGNTHKKSAGKINFPRKKDNSVFGGFGNSAGNSFTLGSSSPVKSPVVKYKYRYVKRKHHKTKHSRHKRRSPVKVTEKKNSYNPFGNAPF